MRLGRCIAIELAFGVSLAAAVGIGSVWGARELRSGWESEARAAAIEGGAISWRDEVEIEPITASITLFDGLADERLLAPLRDSEIKRVRFNHGGSSISLRIEFENGALAAFKPTQSNWQTVPRKEVAAFRINRLLGLSSVPPAIGRMFRREDILAAVEPAFAYTLPRLRAEIIHHDGWVAGELSWWIPEIAHATVDGYNIDSVDGVVTWKRYLTVKQPIPYQERLIVAQISDMVLFDFVINNLDRWSGGNARTSPDGRTLYFMDNTLSFGSHAQGHEKSRRYLQRVQKFSRTLVDTVRNLDAEELRTVLAEDTGPFDELLSEREIKALISRRDYAIAYIDVLVETHGEENVLVFP